MQLLITLPQHNHPSLAIVFIVLSMVAQTVTFLKMVSPLDFFFGSVWHPNLTIYDGQLVKLFGILPLLFGTLLIAFIATAIALPIGLFSAVCITYFTSKKQRNIIKPLIEAMAGIPTVVYGYFALNFISPVLQVFAEYFGKTIPTESALFAGLIVGMMMIPLVTSLVDDVLHSVLLMISCADKNLIDLQVIISRHLIIIFNHNRQKKALAVAASDFYLFLPCARFYR